MASFGGSLNIGTSAIHAAQRGLDVTGQNIANSATPGYTRQRVELESIGGPGIPAFWSRYDGVGEGVKIVGVKRMNDEFLEARARNSNAALGDVEEQAKTMAGIERTFGEPSTTGLQSKLADFWNSWGKAGNDPKGEAPKRLTYERAGEVANHLNMMSDSLTTQWEDATAELKANVTDINTMVKDIARLNDAIRQNNIARVPANELLDQRDVLIAKVTTLTGATVKPAELDRNADFNSQAVDVYIGTNKIVDATHYRQLEVDDPQDGNFPADPVTEPLEDVVVRWGDKYSLRGETAELATSDAASGDYVGVTTGRLAGQLQGMNDTIPEHLEALDHVAQRLADVVNRQQEQGFAFTIGTDGKISGSAEGQALFTTADGEQTGITAANIQLRPGAQPSDLAISKGNPFPAGPDAALDGNNALDMSKHLGDLSGADATYKSLVVRLGTETQSVNRNLEVQRNVVKQAEDARDNVSGVSLNEEMTNLIRFQHSFSAAAKFVGVIDQTLETLINMTR